MAVSIVVPGDQDNPPSAFSASSLQDYADCPRRFQLRYLDKLTWPAAEAESVADVEAHQREALAFHRLVQQHLLGLPPVQLSGTTASENLRRWWRNYLSADLDFAGFVTLPESTLFAHVGSHRLVAKYDLLALKDGKIVVYDWKTYSHRPGTEWLTRRLQTRVYLAVLALAAAQLNNGVPIQPSDIKMIYWFAEFPLEPAEIPYGYPQFRSDMSVVDGLIGEVLSATDFPMTADQRRCRFCAYRSLCDRGEQAGDWKAIEEGLLDAATATRDPEPDSEDL